MRTKHWTHFLLAALLVIIGGVAIGYTEETIIKVKLMNSDTIEVEINGEATVINLDDLADGEERTIEAGEHTIVVKRVGDELKATLDGQEMGGHHGCDAFEEGMIWVGEDGEHVNVHHGAKKVIVLQTDDIEGGEGGPKVIKVMGTADGEAGEEIDLDIILEHIEGELGEQTIDIEVLKEQLGNHAVVKIGEGHTGDHPMVIKKFAGDADSVLFRCPDDGTELKLNKDQATQESYLCPVCGRTMEKMPEVKMMHIMTTVETVDEDE